MLYDVGLCVVAVYANEVVCALALKHFAVAVPTVVIVGKGLMVMLTFVVLARLFALVTVSTPVYVPAANPAEIGMDGIVPPLATKL
jgi:hypothetical protein